MTFILGRFFRFTRLQCSAVNHSVTQNLKRNPSENFSWKRRNKKSVTGFWSMHYRIYIFKYTNASGGRIYMIDTHLNQAKNMHTVQINCFDFNDINLLQEWLWKVRRLEVSVNAPLASERSLHIYATLQRSFLLSAGARCHGYHDVVGLLHMRPWSRVFDILGVHPALWTSGSSVWHRQRLLSSAICVTDCLLFSLSSRIICRRSELS